METSWHRDGNKAVYEGNANNPSTGHQSIRNDGGKIALKSVHGKYLSAQPMVVLSGIVPSQTTGNFSNWVSEMAKNYAQKYARQVRISPTRRDRADQSGSCATRRLGGVHG